MAADPYPPSPHLSAPAAPSGTTVRPTFVTQAMVTAGSKHSYSYCPGSSAPPGTCGLQGGPGPSLPPGAWEGGQRSGHTAGSAAGTTLMPRAKRTAFSFDCVLIPHPLHDALLLGVPKQPQRHFPLYTIPPSPPPWRSLSFVGNQITKNPHLNNPRRSPVMCIQGISWDDPFQDPLQDPDHHPFDSYLTIIPRALCGHIFFIDSVE